MSNVEKVLDKGYIEVVDVLGDDLTPVNAARVSFGGRSKEFTDKDRRLSKFLIKLNNILISIFRNLFSFQFIYVIEINPSLDLLLKKAELDKKSKK